MPPFATRWSISLLEGEGLGLVDALVRTCRARFAFGVCAACFSFIRLTLTTSFADLLVDHGAVRPSRPASGAGTRLFHLRAADRLEGAAAA